MPVRRYLLFATALYALPILRPLAHAIRARGGQVFWCVSAKLVPYLRADEARLNRVGDIRAFNPEAVFSTNNWVPYFFPGKKVQVFHGFNVEKRAPHRGHFRIRSMFDLYCTQCPATTTPFQNLASQYRHFAVVETGWPKLDPLFVTDSRVIPDLRRADGKSVIMYAATFTEGLSSTRALYAEIRQQIERGDRYWLLTLHPKTDAPTVARFRTLAGPNARFFEAVDLVPMMRAADVLVSDTSSVVSEFVTQGKAVVTFRNRQPKPHMLNITEPTALETALRAALSPSQDLLERINTYSMHIHPWRDGQSSDRVLDAAIAMVDGELGRLARKPLNLWRKVQVRMRYHRRLNGSDTE
ncbi:MAG: CDP-glycerol glycerophosphotransferase family protein [Dokdonella sp.]